MTLQQQTDIETGDCAKCLERQQIWTLGGIGGKRQSTAKTRQSMKMKSTAGITKPDFGNAVNSTPPAYGWSRKLYASNLVNYCRMKFGKRKSMDTAQTHGENGYG